MEISELALAVLFSATLDEKLVRPTRLTDLHPGLERVTPSTPSRPPSLAFSVRADRRVPSRESLAREDARAELLHAFANHELLAMELMALALLKFPEAPARFRRGLAAAMIEEGVHLELYRGRIRALGSELGAFPTSGFFWTALSKAASPAHFVASMSLTLEQANLDFAIEYSELFRRLGDSETKAVLDRVLADEIRHVRFGLRWFERFRPSGPELFEAHAQHLELPLTPARAKGPRFSTEARQRAGLPNDYVQRLLVYGASRGRPPDVYVFNADAEDELAGRASRGSSRASRAMIRDLAPVMIFLAKSDDVVLLPVLPTTPHLATLTSVGFSIPELKEERPRVELGARRVGNLEPWARTAGARERVQRMLGREVASLDTDRAWLSKANVPEILASQRVSVEHAFAQRVVVDLEGCARAVAELATAHSKLVLKAAFSAAGRARAWVEGPELDEPSLAFARGALKEGPLVVEPWVKRVADFGALLEVGAKDPVLGVRRFITDAHGRYRGHFLFDPLGAFEPEQRAELGRAKLVEVITKAARAVATALARADCLAPRDEGTPRALVGPAGVDAFIYEDEHGALAVRPVVEINARRTMGHVALALERRVRPRSAAIWAHVTSSEVGREGHGSLADWFESIRARAEIELDTRGRIVSGALATTDPSRAKRVVTVLAVGADATEALSKLQLETWSRHAII
ncbi:MAG: DUF455 family protein [Deltaproteobacteria bacterium]|nr:DUF455 family protein [Deltaproteobacteria bacterium]